MRKVYSHAVLIPSLNQMERMGGGFASALAVAWRRADSNNSEKLWIAFHGLLSNYAPDEASIVPYTMLPERD